MRAPRPTTRIVGSVAGLMAVAAAAYALPLVRDDVERIGVGDSPGRDLGHSVGGARSTTPKGIQPSRHDEPSC